ncbi:transporter [Sporanaerobium hydrogeniformans]|uniref:Transporter n=1 Tax=Sporanaerobium hydrogeniformans TaxID=3072179 RepID=A0AC61DB27_9FIRM|nr:AEC family transporter [Sporanaerobium hydrogeniformans]PHV69802.1 transporter [Sporanaerobium hydrogeniformans]
MNNLMFAINVIIPLFLMIVLGYGLTQFKIWDKAFVLKTNKICFRIFLPILLFNNIYQTDMYAILNTKLLLTTVIGILSVILVASSIIIRIVKEDTRKGVLIQAIFRSNFVLFGIPMVENIFGNQGTGVASTLIAIVIPIFNFAAVFVLELFTNSKKTSLLQVGKAIIHNPLIIASLLAITVSLLHVHFPIAIEKSLKDLAGVATPLSLMMLGAQFELKGTRKNIKPILIGVIGKLFVVPAIVLPIFMQMSFNAYEMVALLAAFAAPTAVNSFIMAQEAGADGELAGQIVVIGTVLSPLSLCLFIYLYKVFEII